MTLLDVGAAWRQARDTLTPRAARWPTPGKMAAELDPTTVQTPALDKIDEALADVAAGRCLRLIINLAPQEGKSERTSRRFPTWMLHRNPALRIAIVSYAFKIARRWGRIIRDDIVAHGAKLDLAVNPEADAGEWQLVGHRGGCYSTGIGGPLTGRAVDLLVLDDPYKDGPQADSEAWNERVRSWWQEVAIPRLGPGVAVVIIQTRWREDDLTGWLLARDGGHEWRVINIPAQADHDPTKGETDPLGRQPGEYLQSARGRTREEWDKRKRDAGERSWLALFQGRPSPAHGNIFREQWWRRYDAPQWSVRDDGVYIPHGFDMVIISADLSFKDTDASDYVCLQVWGRRGITAFLLDQVHERMDFVTTLDRFRRLAAKWPAAVLKLVEDKANGAALISMLRREIPGIVAVEPRGSKVERATAVSPFVEAGNVYLPAAKLAPWVDGLIEEAKAFPRAKNDDRVDTLGQALDRLLLAPLIVDEPIVEDDEDGDPEGSISLY